MRAFDEAELATVKRFLLRMSEVALASRRRSATPSAPADSS
jgi:hypothetical protein